MSIMIFCSSIPLIKSVRKEIAEIRTLRRLQKEMNRAAIVNVVNGMSDPAQHFSFNDKVLEQVVKGGKPNQGQLQV